MRTRNGSTVTDTRPLTATAALAAFASRDLSPVELLEDAFARIDKTNKTVNALTEECRDDALSSARESERRWATGEPAGALDGIPFAFKEEHSIAGRSAQSGSLLTKKAMGTKTHPVVERVLAAGAVVHARTTTPEFSAVPWTNTKLWGTTTNPWNRRFSPGGSSGGSAAALAAGMTTLASGSDIGGSIRLPASYCGLVGFKPPFGRVPALAPYNLDDYCADGPLGRSVADVALLQNVLAGPHPGDPASVRPRYVLPHTYDDIAGMRIALSLDLGDYTVDDAVRRNTLAFADALREAGAIVDEIPLPWNVEQIEATAWVHFGGLAQEIGEIPWFAKPLLMPATRRFAKRAASHAKKTSAMQARVVETELYAPLGRILDEYDALVCPTVSSTGYVAGVDHTRVPVKVNGRDVDWARTLMTVPFNMFGRLPVLSVPSGIAPNGVPTGVQIVGRAYDDATPFRIGSAIEKRQAVWTDPRWHPVSTPEDHPLLR